MNPTLLPIGPFEHILIIPYTQKLMCIMVQFKGSIWFKLILGILNPKLSFKMALMLHIEYFVIKAMSNINWLNINVWSTQWIQMYGVCYV
jgi:hypothetical protein